MYKFDIVNYDIVDINNVLDTDTSTVLISDLHGFTNNRDNSSSLAETIKKEEPNHVLISGDISKNTDWKDKKRLESLLYFLSALSEESSVFVQVGNHDKMSMKKNTIEFFNKVNSARPGKTFMLLNDVVFYDKFRIVGFSPSNYIENNMTMQKSGLAHNEFVKEFEKYGVKLNRVNNYITEFVGHNPHLIAQGKSINGLKSLANVDLFATGHLHNGYFDLLKNRDIDKWVDSGYTQLPISKNINNKFSFKTIRPLYGKIGLCRGTVFIDSFANQKYLLLRNGNYYKNISNDPENPNWALCVEVNAVSDIYINKYKALVISGGIRKFFFAEPFGINVLGYKPEITKINYKVRRKNNIT